MTKETRAVAYARVSSKEQAEKKLSIPAQLKFDRFSRYRDDHVIYKSLLRRIGVNVFSVTEQTDPDTPHGFLIEGILEVISEFYNMNLRNEVLKGMKENATRGFHNGASAPYGYRIETISEPTGASRSVLVPSNNEEVSIVQGFFIITSMKAVDTENLRTC